MSTKFPVFQKFPLDFWVCSVILLASAFLFVDSRGLPDKAVLFPSIMLVCIMGLCAYCMASSVIKRGKALCSGAGEAKPGSAKKSIDLKAVCALAAMTTAYAFVTPYIGFGLASLVFIGAGTVFFGEKNKFAIIGVPVAVMVFVYAFFIYFLDVSIPFFPEIFTT